LAGRSLADAATRLSSSMTSPPLRQTSNSRPAKADPHLPEVKNEPREVRLLRSRRYWRFRRPCRRDHDRSGLSTQRHCNVRGTGNPNPLLVFRGHLQSFIMGQGLSSRVYAVTPYNGGAAYPGRASTGTKVFSYYPFASPYDDVWRVIRLRRGCTNVGDRLYINFTNPVSYVALDFIPSSQGHVHQHPRYAASERRFALCLQRRHAAQDDRRLEPRLCGAHGCGRLQHHSRHCHCAWVAVALFPARLRSPRQPYVCRRFSRRHRPRRGCADTMGGYALSSTDTLTGSGSITGDLTNAGTLDPGSSPGKITVNGNFTQTAAGTMMIDIGGAQENLIDLLDVNGTALIDGASRSRFSTGFFPWTARCSRFWSTTRGQACSQAQAG